MKMKMLFLCTALAALAAPVWSQDTEPLKLIQTIAVPNVNGRFDHFAVDISGQRLFLSGEGQGTVEVIDLAKGQWIHRIPGFVKPHAVYYRRDSNEIFVTDDDGTCKIFR